MFSDLFDPQDPLGVSGGGGSQETVHSTEQSLGNSTILHSATASSRGYPNKAVSQNRWACSAQVC